MADKVTRDEVARLEERFSRSRLQVLGWLPFFGYLLMKLKMIPSKAVPRAAVSPKGELYINPDFALALSDEVLGGVLIHEVLHPAMSCWARQGDRHDVVVTASGERISLWNIAHDYEINAIFNERPPSGQGHGIPDWFALAEGALYDPQYASLGAEAIYDILQKQIPQMTAKLAGGAGEGLADVMERGEPNGSNDGRDVSDPGQGSGPGTGHEYTQSELNSYDKEWQLTVAEAAQVHKEKKGWLPAQLQLFVDRLLDPRVAWFDLLARWIGIHGKKIDFSYRRPSRRSEAAGACLAGITRYGVDHIVVLWDTSGSMCGQEADILGDIVGIADDIGVGVRVITCDAEVTDDVILEPGGDVYQPKGGGGSSFYPAFDRLVQEQCSSVIIAFTDGHIAVPKQKPVLLREVLWVLAEKHDVDPTGGAWGQVLRIREDGSGVFE